MHIYIYGMISFITVKGKWIYIYIHLNIYIYICTYIHIYIYIYLFKQVVPRKARGGSFKLERNKSCAYRYHWQASCASKQCHLLTCRCSAYICIVDRWWCTTHHHAKFLAGVIGSDIVALTCNHGSCCRVFKVIEQVFRYTRVFVAPSLIASVSQVTRGSEPPGAADMSRATAPQGIYKFMEGLPARFAASGLRLVDAGGKVKVGGLQRQVAVS